MHVKLTAATAVVVAALGLTGGAVLLSKAEAQPPGGSGGSGFGAPPMPGGFTGGMPPAPSGLPFTNLKQNLDWAERETVRRALAAAGGVRKDAAEAMGISQRAISYYLAKHRLEDAGES